jgi:hypothetical protein
VVQPPTKSGVRLLQIIPSEDHPYRRVSFSFNGKPKRTRRLEIMTLTYWIRGYDTKKEKEMEELFDSNGEPMFDDPEFFDTYVEKIPIGMKRKSIFYELPYWENLKIDRLLDSMHILKKQSSSIWRYISLNKRNTLVIRGDLISWNTKKKHWLRK